MRRLLEHRARRSQRSARKAAFKGPPPAASALPRRV